MFKGAVCSLVNEQRQILIIINEMVPHSHLTKKRPYLSNDVQSSSCVLKPFALSRRADGDF